MRNALLHDGLEYWRRETPDRVAIMLDDTDTLTFEELARWSDGVAVALQALGAVPQDRIAITGANCMEWVVCAFAILKAGCVIVPFNERFVRDEFAYLIETIEPVIIIADAARGEIMGTIDHGTKIFRMDRIADYRAGAPAGWHGPRVPADSLALINFTSGTTARPKGVMFAHGEHLANYLELGLSIPVVGTGTRQFMSVSLQSAPGTAWGYLFTTTVGGVFCFMRRFEPALALKMLVEQKITYISTFPNVLDPISRLPDFADADLSAINFATASGARVSAELLARWRSKGVLLRQIYGQTEVGGIAITGSEDEARRGALSCGRPMIFTRIRVVRPDGSDCAAGEPGQILVKGPGMMIGYWRNPEATAQTLIDGWVHTGDLGVFDEAGYLTFVDRMKDMIICGGFNVSPSEIEATISRLPEAIEVAVFAIPDDRFGESPAACMFAGAPITPEEVFRHCKASLASFKLPRYIFVLEEPLPRLASGKFNKRKLATDYADSARTHAKLGDATVV